MASARVQPWLAGEQIAASLPATVTSCATALDFGETMQCTIDLAGEIDMHTFTAAIDDVVKVRMTRISGTLNPAVHIYDPDGANMCSAFTSEKIVEINNCVIPRAGIYTLHASDTYRTNTGTYNLYIQRLNNPGNTQPIGFGQILTGTITSAAEINTYTFLSSGGGSARIKMSRTADDLRPRIRIYDPAGTNICSAFTSGSVAEITSCPLASRGTYAILADDNGSRVGSYTLELACAQEPCRPYTSLMYLPLVRKTP
ncbi:MAG TPA: hypothetical protein VFZ66_14400 [Herpetosiphonaceae bacterium]